MQYGALTIENFGTNPVYGCTARLPHHRGLLPPGSLRTLDRAGLTSFETLSNIHLLTPSERYFTYYDLALGYNFLPGEVFIGRKLAMTSSFYSARRHRRHRFCRRQQVHRQLRWRLSRIADGLDRRARRRRGSRVPVGPAWGSTSSRTISRLTSAQPYSFRKELP